MAGFKELENPRRRFWDAVDIDFILMRHFNFAEKR